VLPLGGVRLPAWRRSETRPAKAGTPPDARCSDGGQWGGRRGGSSLICDLDFRSSKTIFTRGAMILMSKVVVTAKMSPKGPHNKIFTDAGFSVAFPPPGVDVFQEQGLLSMLKDADAVVAGSEPYTRRIIQSLPTLGAIVRAGVGFDAVDLTACEEA